MPLLNHVFVGMLKTLVAKTANLNISIATPLSHKILHQLNLPKENSIGFNFNKVVVSLTTRRRIVRLVQAPNLVAFTNFSRIFVYNFIGNDALVVATSQQNPWSS